MEANTIDREVRIPGVSYRHSYGKKPYKAFIDRKGHKFQGYFKTPEEAAAAVKAYLHKHHLPPIRGYTPSKKKLNSMLAKPEQEQTFTFRNLEVVDAGDEGLILRLCETEFKMLAEIMPPAIIERFIKWLNGTQCASLRLDDDFTLLIRRMGITSKSNWRFKPGEKAALLNAAFELSRYRQVKSLPAVLPPREKKTFKVRGSNGCPLPNDA
jgi:hypothetical protein